MAQFTRLETLNAMLDRGLVPVFYNKDIDTAVKITEACAAAGCRCVEFTNRGDFAYEVFAELVKYCKANLPQVIMGVGSVVDPGTAALYMANGANFIVGPILNPEVARVCNRRKIPYSPGCGSASEISEAEELGVEIVKVFPGAEVGGPAFVKAMLGPCPWTRIMPTGGVDATEESVTAWIKAGAAALGIGSNLITKDLVAAGDFAGITAKAQEVLWWVQKARGASLFLGIEHPGLYPEKPAGGQEMADWYANAFGLDVKVGNSSIFVSGKGPGRLEIMKEPAQPKTHVAVRVSNYEEAKKALESKGFAFEDETDKKGVKAGYLTTPDPAGHRVHLLYNPNL
jgi:2-dehydro-3-deoxyphosphogluconate aldolase/(4S)-4-hydroxy-2-oxoglutarate aldolase